MKASIPMSEYSKYIKSRSLYFFGFYLDQDSVFGVGIKGEKIPSAILSLEKHDNITAWERESLASCWAAWRQ